MSTALARIEAGSNAELAKARTALDAANEVVRQGELALRQARQVQIAMVAEKEEVVVRMIDETLPMFLERMQKAVVIREQRWNADVRWRHCVAAGLVALGIFMTGFSVSWWGDSDRIAAFDRCLDRPLQAGGHYYCDVDGFVVQQRTANK